MKPDKLTDEQIIEMGLEHSCGWLEFYDEDLIAFTRAIESAVNVKWQPLMDAKDAEIAKLRSEFNAVINFAIDQGIDAAEFLRAWREGNAEQWPEFDTARSKQ
jgi:FAD/FMN-containing dehydrogenase